MISEELKLIVDKFNEQGKMNFLEETTEEKISEFEKERSVKLPTKFKEWLLFSDGGEFFSPAGIQLYGIEHSMQLQLIEESKIHCAREHFKAISNGEVVYDVVDSYKSLLDMVTK